MLTRFDPLVTASRLRIYGWTLLAVYAVAIAAWFGLARGGLDMNGVPLGADFVQYYAAARMALAGHAVDIFSPTAMFAATEAMYPGNGALFLWNYPPTFLLLVAPLGLLPYGAACLVFLATTGAAYLALARALLAHRLWLFGALALPAAFLNALHGQNAFLTVAALGFGLLWLPTRPVLAGIALGLASYKPHFGILVPFLLVAGRHGQAFAAAAATTLVFAAASALAFGLDAWRAFFANLPFIASVMRDSPDLWPKMATAFGAARLLGASAPLATALQAALSLAVATATIWAWSRPGRHDTKVALAATASLTVSPYLLNYDLLVLAIPLAILARRAIGGATPSYAFLLVLVAVGPLTIGLVELTRLQLMAPLIWCLFAVIWRIGAAERAEAGGGLARLARAV